MYTITKPGLLGYSISHSQLKHFNLVYLLLTLCQFGVYVEEEEDDDDDDTYENV